MVKLGLLLLILLNLQFAEGAPLFDELQDPSKRFCTSERALGGEDRFFTFDENSKNNSLANDYNVGIDCMKKIMNDEENKKMYNSFVNTTEKVLLKSIETTEDPAEAAKLRKALKDFKKVRKMAKIAAKLPPFVHKLIGLGLQHFVGDKYIAAKNQLGTKLKNVKGDVQTYLDKHPKLKQEFENLKARSPANNPKEFVKMFGEWVPKDKISFALDHIGNNLDKYHARYEEHKDLFSPEKLEELKNFENNPEKVEELKSFVSENMTEEDQKMFKERMANAKDKFESIKLRLQLLDWAKQQNKIIEEENQNT